jgi:hypothetical protein
VFVHFDLVGPDDDPGLRRRAPGQQIEVDPAARTVRVLN